jgi:transmembrane sensor
VLAGELRALKRRDRNRRAGIVGGVFVVAAMAGLTWWPQSAAPTGDRFTDSAQAAILFPERRTLSDGSVIEFPAGTELAVDFSDQMRRVALKRGEAHFDVAKDADRPFLVQAAGVDVRAVGTAFAVHMQQTTIEVLVTEGRVEVSSENNAEPANERLDNGSGDGEATEKPSPDRLPRATAIPVDSGNRVVMDLTIPTSARPLPPVVKVPDSEIARRLAWRSPRVEFSDAPLAEVVALLNRCNDVQFVVDDPTLGSVALSGVFRAADTDAFVRMLEAGFGVTAERSGNEIFLRRTQ